MIESVPDLTVMTQGAINYLSKKNDKGFFMMVEGGAVDWAAHANQTDRIIEEQVDFNKALTSSPTFALCVSGGGFPLLGDSCSRSTWFLLHRAA